MTSWGWVVLGMGLAATLVTVSLAWRLRRRLELVAWAEHEVRGPATALGLGLETFARECPDRPRIGALTSEVDRLRVALEDLSAARAGRRAAPRIEPVEVGGLVKAAAAVWDDPAERAGGRVVLSWDVGQAVVTADPRRISQALSNVLANAVEHGRGEVEVVGRRVRGGVRVEVRDLGPGFGPRGGGSAGPARGRGLAIARRAAREAGGELSVLSPSAGAAVAIDLPTGGR